MMRVGLLLLTNLAVMGVAFVSFSLLGGHLDQYGRGLNITSLLVFCAVVGFSGSLISLFLSKWMAKMSTGTRVIDVPRTEEERWLLETVQELAKKAGIGMPEVGIFEAQQSNAFATGWNKNNALVAVSSGLLRRFSRNEARAVMAHEIGHVANGDMITLALIQGVVNTCVMFLARLIGHVVDRVILKNERGHGMGYFITVFVTEITLAVFASMIVAWFSRRREYRADYAGATLADKASMISALARLQAETQANIPNAMPDTLTAFGISSGRGQKMMAKLASHPPLESRIRALQQV